MFPCGFLALKNVIRWPPKLCDRDSLAVEGLFAPLLHESLFSFCRDQETSLCVHTCVSERLPLVFVCLDSKLLAYSPARLVLSRPKTINATTFNGRATSVHVHVHVGSGWIEEERKFPI